MTGIKSKGSFKKTEKFLLKLLEGPDLSILQKYGEAGVAALAANTPVNSGETASSWSYQIVKEEGKTIIAWTNDNVVENGRYKVNVAILLQYGHGTRNGGYVKGIDIVNPALKPIFNKIADEAWEEMVKL